MEALRRSAPVPITFEAMAADTDGYFSADHQKIAIRQGMSEVQTVSATVHEIAHSKLHDPKKYEMLPSWKVVQESEGGTKHDFKLDFATEREAEQFASDMDWRYVDENQFEWRLAVEEDATAEKQAVPFPVSWTVKMKKKQKETQDILSYHTQAAGCSDKARAKASGGRQPIEECGRTGL